MRKLFSLALGTSLPVIASVVLAGCQSENNQTSAAPAQSSMATSATAAATPAPAVATPAPVQLAATSTSVPATATTIRIKAGATAPFKDSSGNVWLPDQGFDGGTS